MKILSIAIFIIMMIGLAGASQYPFGTKVTSFDSDFGAPLRLYAAPNPVPAFSLAYWETGVVLGYDDTDVVYLHQGPAAAGIFANDVRLTPFGYIAAGSKVTPQDNDIGMSLSPLPATATIGWVNSYGGPGHDLNDPVYIHAGPIVAGTLTTTNDVRLTAVGANQPGSKVGNLDPDLPNVFAPPWLPTNQNPITTTAGNGLITFGFPRFTVMYVDINGNNQYDYPDDVYLITGFPPSPVVRVNDVRLSAPV
jgi:hypothetical protein